MSSSFDICYFRQTVEFSAFVGIILSQTVTKIYPNNAFYVGKIVSLDYPAFFGGQQVKPHALSVPVFPPGPAIRPAGRPGVFDARMELRSPSSDLCRWGTGICPPFFGQVLRSLFFWSSSSPFRKKSQARSARDSEQREMSRPHEEAVRSDFPVNLLFRTSKKKIQ